MYARLQVYHCSAYPNCTLNEVNFVMFVGACLCDPLSARICAVSSLRAVLAEEVGLPWEKQILLVSGGFQLEPGDKLSECGAGMDKTNPIYVFTRTQEDDDLAQMPDVLQVNGAFGDLCAFNVFFYLTCRYHLHASSGSQHSGPYIVHHTQ
ncbi:hypothetical protein AHF37_06603 [Paragonimus kellicotti]|nr:hypothetical protein AHF37_06603 [Paragonimus kellicotti]